AEATRKPHLRHQHAMAVIATGRTTRCPLKHYVLAHSGWTLDGRAERKSVLFLKYSIAVCGQLLLGLAGMLVSLVVIVAVVTALHFPSIIEHNTNHLRIVERLQPLLQSGSVGLSLPDNKQQPVCL